MITLIGVAIVGKSNEPLYLRDCEDDDEIDEQKSLGESDPFGFRSINQEIRNSLPLQSQILIHAALDCFAEKVETSPTGQMPVIKNTSSSSPNWIGNLLELDGQAVYGYVTATNIKFMAITKGPCEAKELQEFLKDLHTHYVSYTMNPFCRTRGPIVSTTFDEKVRESMRGATTVTVVD